MPNNISRIFRVIGPILFLLIVVEALLIVIFPTGVTTTAVPLQKTSSETTFTDLG